MECETYQVCAVAKPLVDRADCHYLQHLSYSYQYLEFLIMRGRREVEICILLIPVVSEIKAFFLGKHIFGAPDICRD